jgi:hypothetical protein
MTQSLEVQTIVNETYSELVEYGYDPLAISAAFVITALSIYASQLSKKDFEQVISTIAATSNTFTDSKARKLN